MQYDIVHTGGKVFDKHNCKDSLPSTKQDANLTGGTIVKCTFCGRYWYVKREMLADTYYWWQEVYWWSWIQWFKIWTHSSD